MNELQLQDKYLTHFFCERTDGLGYKEAQANTVTEDLFLEADLLTFLRDTSLNKDNFKELLRSYSNDEVKAMADIREFLAERRKDATNMAIFINNNKTFTFKGIKFYLFYPSGGEFNESKMFDENIFSIVQEFSYSYRHKGKQIFIFRPDLTLFLNGIFLGYSELKSNFNNQNAKQNGRKKVIKDYLEATKEYLGIVKDNDLSQTIRKDFLKIFEKAIHITSTDIGQTYIIRTISNHFSEIRSLYDEGKYDFESYEKKCLMDFKAYPVSDKRLDKTLQFEEVFRALYSKEMIEKEILYYNFIEKEVVKGHKGKETKNEKGYLIAPRPKQKFGTDKILAKIDELLEHESDDNYFINKLEAELTRLGISEQRKQELIEKRQRYQNNKNIYSLLLQYAAGFGKSNIIGWSTLQLKDLRRNDQYVYDKVMIIVDRLQLRDQIGDKMFNMNINNRMFIEANSKETFLEALRSDTRIVIVNIQKFGTIKNILSKDVVSKLNGMRIAFLIDEIHRSNTGTQHEEMISLFDDLQSSFDEIEDSKNKKKNLIIGFTATPSDHTLARFGEYNKYAESEKIWVPFDSYTMKEAIEDGYILNPLRGIVPVSAKMYFEEPENVLEGFEDDLGYEDEIPDGEDTGIDAEGKKYAIRKKKIYENPERITAISKFIVNRLVTTVYPKIRGYGKAMLAVSSIKSAIRYKQEIDKIYAEVVKENKYSRFENAPIYIVYSPSQDYSSPTNLNNGLTEEKVLKQFTLEKNGLIIVVDKLQTGFDEKKLQTLFLDKEITGINAIQTISRVNRTTKYKNDCKIIDFSYKNVNVRNIKKAFEHFSNVVVSDFDPIGDEKLLIQLYGDLRNSDPFVVNFALFEEESKNFSYDTNRILDIEDDISRWIKTNANHAKELKSKVNQYFRILNNIEFVIDFDKTYSDEIFLNFWKRFNNEYNNINKTDEIVDDVIIYYDNKIGIIETHEEEAKEPKEKKERKKATQGDDQKKFKFNILDVIEKRNQEEAELEKMIKEFEEKIEKLFEFINHPDNGRRLIAKIKDTGNAFSEDEIYIDFELLYKKFVRRNRKELGDFFIKETKDLTNKLCDDFEEWLGSSKKDSSTIEEIIKQGENATLEFKASYRWNMEQDALDKKMEYIIMKTISAFSNGQGGTLIIGVQDDGKALGLEKDYSTLREANKDEFELHLRSKLNQTFGKVFSTTNLTITFPIIDGKEICRIDVKAGSEPTFLEFQDDNGQKSEKFYVRSGNTSQPLEKASEVSEYIRRRFN